MDISNGIKHNANKLGVSNSVIQNKQNTLRPSNTTGQGDNSNSATNADSSSVGTGYSLHSNQGDRGSMHVNTSNDVAKNQESIKLQVDNMIPSSLDQSVPKKEELYGTDALLAEAGIDKQGHMRIDNNTVLDLNAPELKVIKIVNGKKVVMPLEEYTKQEYLLSQDDTKNRKVDAKSKFDDTLGEEHVGNKGSHTIELSGAHSNVKQKDIDTNASGLLEGNNAIPNVDNMDAFAVEEPSSVAMDVKKRESGVEQERMVSYSVDNDLNNINTYNMTKQSKASGVQQGANANLDVNNMQTQDKVIKTLNTSSSNHIPGVEDSIDGAIKYEDDPDGVPTAQPSKVLDPSLSKYKILIIEDNSDVRYQYEFILKREGFTVITANNGEKGIITAIKERPQLILLDILMPEVDGWQVLKALRENTATYKPKIMIVSNLGSPEDIQKAYNLGADMFLIKADTTLQEIVKKVKHVLMADGSQNNILIVPLPKTPEVTMFLKRNLPELSGGVCPDCGGPLGLKLIPQKHQDLTSNKVILDFNARIICLRCGKEWH